MTGGPGARATTMLARWTSPARVAAVAVLGSILVRGLGRLADIDLWWHLKTGELIASGRSIPHTDPFSFTVPGKAWTVQEWGSEVILHAIRQAFGLRGIVVWRAVMLLLVYAIVARMLVRRMGSGIGTWVLLALVAYAGAVNWTERPNLFSFALFALTLSLLDRRDGRVWWFVPAAALWANLHGMVTLGIGVVALAALAAWLEVRLHRPEADALHARRLGLVALAGSAAALLNPRGFGLYTHAARLVRTVSQYVTEWASPDFHQLGPLLFLTLVVVAVLALAFDRHEPSLTDAALLAAFLVLAFGAARNLAVAAIAVGLVAAGHLPGAAATLRPGTGERAPGTASSLLGGAGLLLTAAALAIVGASAFPRSGQAVDVIETDIPLEAIDAASAGEGVRLFTRDVWAGLVIDRHWPGVHVYYDSRVDMYGPVLAGRYVAVLSAGPSWQRNLDRYCTERVLVRPRDPIAQILSLNPDWTESRRDRLSVLFTRRTPASTCS